jgi:hypothetical protein
MSKVAMRTAYEQMCHFEDYPQFMSGMQRVIKLSEEVTHWVRDTGDARQPATASVTGISSPATAST